MAAQPRQLSGRKDLAPHERICPDVRIRLAVIYVCRSVKLGQHATDDLITLVASDCHQGLQKQLVIIPAVLAYLKIRTCAPPAVSADALVPPRDCGGLISLCYRQGGQNVLVMQSLYSNP